jgi:O-antigen/teichoic acid export membrane protein
MAFKVANLVQMIIVASLLTSYSNYFFKTLNNKDSIPFFQKFVKLYIVLLTLGGLGIVLFSPEIIYVVSSGSDFFQAAVMLIPVLIAGLIFSGLRQLFTLPLNKHKKTRVISIILILSAVINITGNFILVPQYGKMGASVATLFSQLFALVWFGYAVKKIESISFSLTRHLFMMLFWAGICYAGMQFFYLPLLTGWLVKSLFLILFVAVLFAFGLIQKDIITVVQKMMKGKAS